MCVVFVSCVVLLFAGYPVGVFFGGFCFFVKLSSVFDAGDELIDGS